MGTTKDIFMEERQAELASPLELNTLMNQNKEAIRNRVMLAIDSIRDGQTDPVEALIFAKKGKELFDLLEKNVRPLAESKQIQKGYAAFDCTIVEKSTGDKYDFSVCNDARYNEMIAQLNELQDQIKEREAFLKTLKDPMSTMDGEIINPPSVTHGKLGLALTLK